MDHELNAYDELSCDISVQKVVRRRDEMQTARSNESSLKHVIRVVSAFVFEF